VSPNSDTPYSMVGMDLRAEPMVLTVPPIEAERYFSIQLIDAYTHDFDYIGSRATGNQGGSYLVAEPGWDGDTPAGVQKVFRSETQFALAVYRTQLFNSDDLDNVKAVQAGYRAQTLSAFLGEPTPSPAPPAGFVEPQTPVTQKTSLRFFTILSYILRFCPTHPSEVDLRAQFAEVGFDDGALFDPDSLAPEEKAAMEQGMADARAEFAAFKEEQMDTKKVTAGDIFGTREYLENNYLYRMAAGVLGLYGNSKHEAMYPSTASTPMGSRSPGHPGTRCGSHPDNSPRVLVPDHVRTARESPRRQPPKPLSDQLSDAAAPEARPRRRTHPAPTTRDTRPG
jgi:hypothetical protein